MSTSLHSCIQYHPEITVSPPSFGHLLPWKVGSVITTERYVTLQIQPQDDGMGQF